MLSLAGVPKWLCQQEALENNWSSGICSPTLLCQAGRCWDSSPLPGGWPTGYHSSRHSIRPLPWCCVALLTGGLWRPPPWPPPPSLPFLPPPGHTSNAAFSTLCAKNNLHGACHYLLVCLCVPDCTLTTHAHVLLISMRDLGTCVLV